MTGASRSKDRSAGPAGKNISEASVARWLLESLSRNEQEQAEQRASTRDEPGGVSHEQQFDRESRHVATAHREVLERFESAFVHAPIGMALISMDGSWLQFNDSLCRITGHTTDQLSATTLRGITHADDADIDADSRARLLADKLPNYQVEKRLRHARGTDVWVLMTVSIVRDEDRHPLYVVIHAQDISERKEMERLEHIVNHDFLTGLLNRRNFETVLSKEVSRAERYNAPGAVLLIDLDNFKDVNDTFGHKAGDDVLKGVAGLLRQRLRNTDIIARVGGDEFAVLLPQTNADEVQIVAREVVRALGLETAVLADKSIRITASVGVAMFNGQTDAEIMACADLAMYEAKETGRNRFEIYRPLMTGRERVSARFIEVERIRRTLESGRMILFSQPILDLGTGEVCQHELLLRLPDEESGKPLPPSAFLYSAERSGLIQAIDCWVVREAIALIASHARAGKRLALHVNISGKSIGNRMLVEHTEAALDEFGINPTQLIFEITETAAISNIEEAKAFAFRMHDRGCRFALDDFGAGFGSFYYLKHF
ncbi:MAG: diguanylate cyclase, partial [Candidatus Eisenbacteria bacterium]